MIKKFLLWLFFLLICVMGLITYAGYRSFNTEAFKTQIVQSIQEATGRTFNINGAYKLTWTPLPTMTLENVTLSNIDNAQNPEMLKAEKVQIQIEWSSLFTSSSRIKNVIVVKPEIWIERISRSVSNLQFPLLLAARNVLNNDAPLMERPSSTQIDNILIEDGRLHYINQIYKTTYDFSAINGNLTMGSLNGPFGFTGSASFDKLPLKIKSSLSSHEVSQPMDFITEVSMPEANAHVKIDTKFNPENIDAYLVGAIAFDVGDPNALLSRLDKPLLSKEQNLPMVGSVSIDLGTTKTLLPDFILKVGGDDNAVTVNASYIRESSSQPGHLVLNVSALNIDDWQKTLSGFFNKKIPQQAEYDFNVTISQVVWHGQIGTTLNLVGEVRPNQIYIKNGSILLPGSTTVQLSGRFAQIDTNWSTLAQIDLQSQNLASALGFFNPPQNKLTDALQKIQLAELKASLDWSSAGFSLEIPALSLNNATGVARYAQQSGKPTEFILELSNIDLNTYLTKTTERSPAQALDDLFSLFSTTQMPEKPMHWEFVLENAQWAKTNFQNMTLLADTRKGSANFEAIATTQDQDSLVLKTDIQNLGTPSWTLSQNKFEIDTKDLNEVLKNLDIEIDNKWMQETHQFNAIGEITGNQKEWKIEAAAHTPSINIDVNGMVANNNLSDMAIRFQHQSLPHLMVELWGQNPLQNLGGSLVLEANLSQEDQLLALSDMQIKAGTEQASGHALYNLKTKEWAADLLAPTLDLQKILPDMGRLYLNATGFDSNPFDFSVLKDIKGSLNLQAEELLYQTTHIKNVILKAHISDNTFYLDDFTALGDDASAAAVQIHGSFDWLKTPTFNFDIITKNLSLTTPIIMFDGVGLTGGRLTSEWHLASSGETPLQMARSMSGNGQIDLQDSSWVGADLASLLNTLQKTSPQESSKETLASRFKHDLSNGSTPLKTIKGNFAIRDGLWQIAAATIDSNEANTESATVDWDIPTSAIQAKVPLFIKEYASFPSIIIKFAKSQKGVTYTSDTVAFISAFLEELEQRKLQQQEAERKAQQEALARKLAEAKQEASDILQKLTSQILFWPQQLTDIPDIETQKTVLTAQNFQAQLEQALQDSETTQAQYQNLTKQTNKSLADLDKAKARFMEQQKELLHKKGIDKLKKAESLVAQINELHQKRPAINLLVDLLQNTEVQKDIIARAVAQYDKPLTYNQVLQVADIIQEAFDKISKAYTYAEKVYSGRQNVSNSNAIRRTEP